MCVCVCTHASKHTFIYLHIYACYYSIIYPSIHSSIVHSKEFTYLVYAEMGRLINSSLSYFSFQPVLHDWYSKGCSVCSAVLHIKDPLLLVRKSSSCNCGSRFPQAVPEWSFTLCLMPYNHKKNVWSAPLNTKNSSFFCVCVCVPFV